VKITISGKGGSGKTTIAGTLARLLAQEGYPVVAIDGDSNPNLALMLGLSPDQAAAVPAMPPELLKDIVDEEGNNQRVLAVPVEEIVERYGTTAADGVDLLAMKRIDHAGKG
jgi:CO dehydrogenase maturation factor